MPQTKGSHFPVPHPHPPINCCFRLLLWQSSSICQQNSCVRESTAPLLHTSCPLLDSFLGWMWVNLLTHPAPMWLCLQIWAIFMHGKMCHAKREANLSLSIKSVFVLLPMNRLMPETLIRGVDSLQGGNNTRKSWGLSIQAGICFRNYVPSSSGLLWSVFVEKDVCFTPGFDHWGFISVLASNMSI